MSVQYTLRAWFAALVLTTLVVLLGIHRLDIPIATWSYNRFHWLQHLGDHLGSTVLVGGEGLVALLLAIYRITSGRLHPLAKVMIIACATSLAVFAFNEVVLKVFFGMVPPYDVVKEGAPHVFHFQQGSWQSSFPSGHMVLAMGFIPAFAGQDRRLVAVMLAGAALAAAMLVAGGWHFLSDVIAGAFIGATAGLTAALLWARHSAEPVSR